MSDLSSLTELARFVGKSGIIGNDASANRLTVNAIVNQLSHRPQKPRVTELLAVVLALSARTRRMVMPKVEIDLDVFGPGGHRAVRIALPD